MSTTTLSFTHSYPVWDHRGYPPHPIIPVRLIGLAGKFVDTYALVDTGADYSLFDAKWSTRLGINYRTGRRVTITGLGGASRAAYLHDIEVVFSDSPTRYSPRSRCTVGFSVNMGDEPGDQLIGRYDVFDDVQFAFTQANDVFYVGRFVDR